MSTVTFIISLIMKAIASKPLANDRNLNDAKKRFIE